MTNTDWITGGHDQKFVTALIGAVETSSGWHAINSAIANQYRHQTYDFGDTIRKVDHFQRAICTAWRGFTSATAERFAKGLTFSTDMSSPSFVMKALKTGFDAVGISVSTYATIRMSSFTLADVIQYLRAREVAATPPPTDAALVNDFSEFAPDPSGTLTEDKPIVTSNPNLPGDRRHIPHIFSQIEHRHNGQFAYAAETAHINLPRVIAYGFRGDSRPPSEIKEFGGFLVNYTTRVPGTSRL
ncbi:hypothetical protein ABLE91_03990 [Aquabacter sp. CN5-332]|uniref:hypothetical protein n=1 Tax=Aquabacter sp. CN5-332 TaxID=3156608 RepID=UPI0032B396FE